MSVLIKILCVCIILMKIIAKKKRRKKWNFIWPSFSILFKVGIHRNYNVCYNVNCKLEKYTNTITKKYS